jgi:acylphosphatase
MGRAAAERQNAVVTGRVQGVGYRAATAAEARRLGLAGWVRNRPDGAVELEAEGPADAVAALLAWCRVGPPSAKVREVVASARVATGEAGPFRVAW